MSMSKVHCEKLLERAHLMGMDAGRRIGVAPIGVAVRRELNNRELAFVLDYNGKVRVIEMPLQVVYDDIDIESGKLPKSISYNQYTNQFYILSSNSPQIRILY